VLIADETGFLKSGRHSAAVRRQYTGAAGKITNCQVGVFLAYAVPGAGTRVLVDWRLYVPQSWTEDKDRCAGAGIPRDTQFATKPELARQMVEHAIDVGLPFPGSPPMRLTGTTASCRTGCRRPASRTRSRWSAALGSRLAPAA
jgi:SRSO17 transposase